MHPGRTASILINDQIIGFLGQVHPQLANDFAIEATYVAEFDLQAVLAINEPIVLMKFLNSKRLIAILPF